MDEPSYEPRLRKYPSWVLWLCFTATILSGVFCSIAFKWQNKQSAPLYKGGEPEAFNGALYQTYLMFIAEAFSLFVYYVDTWVSNAQGKRNLFDFAKSQEEYRQKKGPFYLWCITAAFDMTATLMINTAMQVTYASTVQMLRNTMMVITALIQPLILKRSVKVHEWLGVVVITAAMVLSAVPAVQTPDTSADTSTGKVILGILLTVVGTSIQSVQLLMEELFFRKGRCAPLRAVGWEGTAGLVYCSLVWPVYQKLNVEDVTGSWYASSHSGMITAIALIYLPAGTLFNVAGLATTMLGSGLLRGVCFAMRSPLVWVVSLIIKWQDFDYWSLASAIVFVWGFAVYVNKIGIPKDSALNTLVEKPVNCCCCIEVHDDDIGKTGNGDQMHQTHATGPQANPERGNYAHNHDLETDNPHVGPGGYPNGQGGPGGPYGGPGGPGGPYGGPGGPHAGPGHEGGPGGHGGQQDGAYGGQRRN